MKGYFLQGLKWCKEHIFLEIRIAPPGIGEGGFHQGNFRYQLDALLGYNDTCLEGS